LKSWKDFEGKVDDIDLFVIGNGLKEVNQSWSGQHGSILDQSQQNN